MKLAEKIVNFGVSNEMSVSVRKSTKLFNITMRIALLVILVISGIIYFVKDLVYVPAGLIAATPLIALTVFLNYKGKVTISAFITGIIFPALFICVSILAKLNDEGTNAVFYILPRIGIIVLSAISFSVLIISDKVKAITVAIFSIIILLLFNKIHGFFGVEVKDSFVISSDVQILYHGTLGLYVFIILLSVFLHQINVSYEKIVIAQKDELTDRNVEITAQNEELEKQRNIINEQNRSITDSIRYAKRIQQAAIPDDGLDTEKLDYFILFKPRDIVSGDFYWIKTIEKQEQKNHIIIAADCTGHGVPGAFVSMLGISFLNEITVSIKELHADIILNDLRTKIKESLFHKTENTQAKDGMDIALCIIDDQSLEMSFAGAHNPLFLVRNGELIIFKADRQPVGANKIEKPFSVQKLQLEKNDTFYLFSDGYIDQFGGPGNEKFKSGRFKNMILETSLLEMNKRKDFTEKVIEDWRANQEQLDDILLLGFEIK